MRKLVLILMSAFLCFSLIGLCACKSGGDTEVVFSAPQETEGEIGEYYTVILDKGEAGGQYVEPEIKVTCGGKDVALTNRRFFIDSFTDYVITYSFGAQGKTFTTRVKVKDTTDPVLSFSQAFAGKVKKGSELEIPKITVTDNSGETLTADVKVYRGAVDESNLLTLTDSKYAVPADETQRSYYLVATASDSHGNLGKLEQPIKVQYPDEIDEATDAIKGIQGGTLVENAERQIYFAGIEINGKYSQAAVMTVPGDPMDSWVYFDILLDEPLHASCPIFYDVYVKNMSEFMSVKALFGDGSFNETRSVSVPGSWAHKEVKIGVTSEYSYFDGLRFYIAGSAADSGYDPAEDVVIKIANLEFGEANIQFPDPGEYPEGMLGAVEIGSDIFRAGAKLTFEKDGGEDVMAIRGDMPSDWPSLEFINQESGVFEKGQYEVTASIRFENVVKQRFGFLFFDRTDGCIGNEYWSDECVPDDNGWITFTQQLTLPADAPYFSIFFDSQENRLDTRRFIKNFTLTRKGDLPYVPIFGMFSKLDPNSEIFGEGAAYTFSHDNGVDLLSIVGKVPANSAAVLGFGSPDGKFGAGTYTVSFDIRIVGNKQKFSLRFYDGSSYVSNEPGASDYQAGEDGWYSFSAEAIVEADAVALWIFMHTDASETSEYYLKNLTVTREGEVPYVPETGIYSKLKSDSEMFSAGAKYSFTEEGGVETLAIKGKSPDGYGTVKFTNPEDAKFKAGVYAISFDIKVVGNKNHFSMRFFDYASYGYVGSEPGANGYTPGADGWYAFSVEMTLDGDADEYWLFLHSDGSAYSEYYIRSLTVDRIGDLPYVPETGVYSRLDANSDLFSQGAKFSFTEEGGVETLVVKGKVAAGTPVLAFKAPEGGYTAGDYVISFDIKVVGNNEQFSMRFFNASIYDYVSGEPGASGYTTTDGWYSFRTELTATQEATALWIFMHTAASDNSEYYIRGLSIEKKAA